MEHITIVGQGKVGTSLAEAISANGRARVSGLLPARAEEYVIDSEIVIIAARDDAVAAVSRKVIDAASERLEMIVQTAGSVPPSALATRQGVWALTLHPIQTISKASADIFNGIYWMASSPEPDAIEWASEFTTGLGGAGLLVLEEEMLPLYHAMTVFSSNFITLLFLAVEEIAESMELDPKSIKGALRVLSQNALENVLEKPAESVLTGPFARKDLLTIRKHQHALTALDPKMKCIYDAFLQYAIKRKPGPARGGTPKR